MIELDKRKVIGNIRSLLERSNTKVGTFEKDMGKDIGYLARLDKEGNKTLFSIDFLVNAAEYLGVTLDYLLYANAEEVSSDVEYLLRFLGQMRQKTMQGETRWARYTKADLNAQLNSYNYASAEIIESHRDEWTRKELDELGYMSGDKYLNSFRSNAYGADTVFSGDCYKTEIKNGWVFLINVSSILYPERCGAKELWIVSKPGANGPSYSREYICGTDSLEQIRESVEALYSVVEHADKYPVIKSNVARLIDAYMQDDITDDPEPKREPTKSTGTWQAGNLDNDEIPF